MARVGESNGAPGVRLNCCRLPNRSAAHARHDCLASKAVATTEAGQSWPAWVNHTGRQAKA